MRISVARMIKKYNIEEVDAQAIASRTLEFASAQEAIFDRLEELKEESMELNHTILREATRIANQPEPSSFSLLAVDEEDGTSSSSPV